MRIQAQLDNRNGRFSMKSLKYIALCVAVFGLQTSAHAADLVIWWSKGISETEDRLVLDAVASWEKKTGKSVDISFLGTGDVTRKTVAAVEAGEPPDLAFSFSFDLAQSPIWAQQNLLADVSDVLTPIAERFQPAALRSVKMLNGETGKASYYAIPWSQMTPMMHYWRDLLEEAGFAESDVPRDWTGFFSFWCDDVRPALAKAGKRVRGVGLSPSTSLNDAFFNIHMWLKAYGVRPLDEDGNLTLDDPEVRARAVEAIEAYAQPIIDGCAPPNAATWKGADDNVAFINKQFLAAMNSTLSIPIALKEKNPDAYYKNIRTIQWPNNMDGSPATALVSVKQVVTFRASPHPDNAKDFMSHLLQPEIIGGIIKGGGGRFTPVMTSSFEDPFYSDPADPHRSVLYKMFFEGGTEPYPHVYNWRYGRVMSDGIWQKAVGRMIADGMSAKETVDIAVEEIAAVLKD